MDWLINFFAGWWINVLLSLEKIMEMLLYVLYHIVAVASGAANLILCIIVLLMFLAPIWLGFGLILVYKKHRAEMKSKKIT